MLKPHYQIPILECWEPLVAIPPGIFAQEHPHPYLCLGAPYGGKSPYFLRQGVLEQLMAAQDYLQQDKPDWRIQIFDAYRPLAVQQFMVDYTLANLSRQQELEVERLTASQRQTLLEQVYQFWAVPSPDPATPPPHSTGAAIDVTLVDAAGVAVDMGSPIDELSPRSYPDYFAPWCDRTPYEAALGLAPVSESSCTQFHHQREQLRQVMQAAGFRQHPQEWWHFSLGDQLWAWLMHQEEPSATWVARYGAVLQDGLPI